MSEQAQMAILDWYAQRGRSLAFRESRDPYATLVAETMAQQTQASRAATYWERFMLRFPNVRSLAAATPAEVLRAWAGLGYDRRALALRRAAVLIVNEHAGEVPSDVATLATLPGVGPYTARAVAAFAFGAAVGPVDVNVRRVLARSLTDPADPPTAARLQEIADASVPVDRSRAWTHALMDIGATVCRPRTPRCADCPVRPWCRFAAAGQSDATRRPTASTRQGAAAAVPFSATNRWLRGRILDRARAEPDGSWATFDGSIGVHDVEHVRSAVRQMETDGLLEIDVGDEATVDTRAAVDAGAAVTGPLRARLAIA
jgi:A/G-specific adenine glycosylase